MGVASVRKETNPTEQTKQECTCRGRWGRCSERTQQLPNTTQQDNSETPPTV